MHHTVSILAIAACMLDDSPRTETPVMRMGEDVRITGPAEARAFEAKNTFGPKRLLEHASDRTLVTVPVKVLLDEENQVHVEFEQREVSLPLTQEQLPQVVLVFTRFEGGIEKRGTFIRNPTKQWLFDPHLVRVNAVRFWPGLGFHVATSGGAMMRCGSVDVSFDGKVQHQEPPKPTIAPGYASEKPLSESTEAPIEYGLNELEVFTLTPTFEWPAFATRTKRYCLFLEDAPQGQICDAWDLPLEPRRCAIPEGALQTGRTYELQIAAESELGDISYGVLRFRTSTPTSPAPQSKVYILERANMTFP